MAITKKPPKKGKAQEAKAEQTVDDAKIKELINKGGTPPTQPKSEPAKSNSVKNVQLRLTEEVLEDIDSAIKRRSRIVKVSRHTWLLEAIAEKLDRETEKTSTSN